MCRIVICSLIIGFGVIAQVASSADLPKSDNSKPQIGQVKDSRERLVEKLRQNPQLLDKLDKSSETVAQFRWDEGYNLDRRLGMLAINLRQATSDFSKINPAEIRDLQSKLKMKRKEVEDHLNGVQRLRRSRMDQVANFQNSRQKRILMLNLNVDRKSMDPVELGVLEDCERRAQFVQRCAQALPELANRAAKLAKELDALEQAANLVDDLVKELPSPEKKTPSAKK